ncbi:50S ribosomal protein L29 [Candidatus Microgenomates bacterium]|nr:50S ribosomal protein L29 [Candidatus Microgenomates bacterium]
MKNKQIQELRTKEQKELLTLLVKKQEEVEKILLETRTGKVKNVHSARDLRREIAQIKTLIQEKRV